MRKICQFMQHSTQIPEVPKYENFEHFVWHCVLLDDDQNELLTLGKIQGEIPDIPEHFLPPTYALEFLTHGSIKGRINQIDVHLQPNSCALYLADSLLDKPEVSSDAQFYILGFTTQFAESLNTQISHAQLSKVLLNPAWHISEQHMQIVLQYISLLRSIIEENNKWAAINLVRSLLYFLAFGYKVDPRHAHTVSRVEQICGQYQSLVELHCREQHAVEWYADQMHLSPKYLSNVVKKTLGSSPNALIDKALTRQAKSLLSSTSLSVQQISDRLGFLNQSHFGTFFKRQAGLNPSAFKRSVR